jgi:hypothetical protein
MAKQETEMNITGVESIVYGTDDIEASTRFHVDWGLTLTENGTAGSDFSLPDNTTIHIRGIDDPSLPPASVPGPTAREVIWGVQDKESVEAIGAELTRDREVTAGTDGALHSRDDYGYRIGFRLTARTPEPVEFPDSNTAWNAPRKNERAEIFSRKAVRQERIFHAVYWAPGDTERHAQFYLDRLGFKLTESIKGLGFFMRGGASHDHHNLFLNHDDRNFGFQHVAYEVQDFDEVLRCGTHMEEQGWQSHIGPGRHYFGSGWFWYFQNPAGGLAETGMDSDYIGEHWTPLNHETIPAAAARPWMIRREEKGLFVGHGDWPHWEGA